MQRSLPALRARRPGPIHDDMGAIRTNAAAAMLGVSPSTLRSWERRFGFPEPRRSAGGHRQFDLAQIEALRAAFQETQNVSSAVALARGRGTGPATPGRLRDALARFDEAAADRVLEESLAVRSVERTVEEVLLPGIAALDEGSAEAAFGWRWATGWLAAARRGAPAGARGGAAGPVHPSAPRRAARPRPPGPPPAPRPGARRGGSRPGSPPGAGPPSGRPPRSPGPPPRAPPARPARRGCPPRAARPRWPRSPGWSVPPAAGPGSRWRSTTS